MTKILVVEDSATQAQELAWLLESEGLEVEIARDGGNGLARCRQGGIDVVLSDVIMPEIDGYELCKRLKGDPITPSPSVRNSWPLDTLEPFCTVVHPLAFVF